GLVIGLAFASRVWLDVPAAVTDVPTARIALMRDRTASLAFALTMAVTLGFVGGVGYTVSSRLSFGGSGLTGLLFAVICGAAVGGGVAGYVGYGWAGCIAFGLAGLVAGRLTFTAGGPAHEGSVGLEYGIVLGLAACMAALFSRAWGRFVLARIWLAVRGRQPW